jgi:hypothetical protein
MAASLAAGLCMQLLMVRTSGAAHDVRGYMRPAASQDENLTALNQSCDGRAPRNWLSGLELTQVDAPRGIGGHHVRQRP